MFWNTPSYRVTTLKGLLIHTWERTWEYIKKAGTVILRISIVLPVVALSVLIFMSYYAPCFVTVICISKEAGSWKWGAFAMSHHRLPDELAAVSVTRGRSAYPRIL